MQGLALLPRCKKILGLWTAGAGLSVWSWHVLPVAAWVFSGYSGFLPHAGKLVTLNYPCVNGCASHHFRIVHRHTISISGSHKN